MRHLSILVQGDILDNLAPCTRHLRAVNLRPNTITTDIRDHAIFCVLLIPVAVEKSFAACVMTPTTIWSEDLNNLFPFYRDVIGLKVSMESPEFAIMGDQGKPTLNLGTHSEVIGKATDPYRHFVGLDSGDLDTDFRRLQAAGVEFIEQPTDYDGLRIATLKDPEGNLVQLFQPSR